MHLQTCTLKKGLCARFLWRSSPLRWAVRWKHAKTRRLAHSAIVELYDKGISSGKGGKMKIQRRVGGGRGGREGAALRRAGGNSERKILISSQQHPLPLLLAHPHPQLTSFVISVFQRKPPRGSPSLCHTVNASSPFPPSPSSAFPSNNPSSHCPSHCKHPHPPHLPHVQCFFWHERWCEAFDEGRFLIGAGAESFPNWHLQLKYHVEHPIWAVRLQQLHNVGVLQHVADAGLPLQICKGREREGGGQRDRYEIKLQSRSNSVSRSLVSWLTKILGVVQYDLWCIWLKTKSPQYSIYEVWHLFDTIESTLCNFTFLLLSGSSSVIKTAIQLHHFANLHSCTSDNVLSAESEHYPPPMAKYKSSV